VPNDPTPDEGGPAAFRAAARTRTDSVAHAHFAIDFDLREFGGSSPAEIANLFDAMVSARHLLLHLSNCLM
jgi:hypothetical protein